MSSLNDISLQKIIARDVIIASGTTTEAIDLLGGTLMGISTPAGIASTGVKIAHSATIDGTYVNVIDPLGSYMPTAGDEVNLTLTSSNSVPIPVSLTQHLRFIKLVFNQTETAKTFQLFVRSID